MRQREPGDWAEIAKYQIGQRARLRLRQDVAWVGRPAIEYSDIRMNAEYGLDLGDMGFRRSAPSSRSSKRCGRHCR